MAIIKEFREFFLRHTQVTGGSKPDQETGFITQYIVGSALKFNRFLKGDYPSEAVFKKLFESITFKKNVEDTASNVNQGLVRTATDVEARDRQDNGTGTFTNTVQPHQLTDVVTNLIAIGAPGDDVVLTTTIDNGVEVKALQRIFGSTFRKVFRIRVITEDSIVIDNVTKKLHLENDLPIPGNDKVYGTNNAGVRGWYDNCCVGAANGVIAGVANVTAQGFEQPLIVNYSVPVDLATLAGNYFIALNAEVPMTDDAFPLQFFNYGIAINGVPIFTKNFDGKDVSRGMFNMNINTEITLAGGAADVATFFINAFKFDATKNITNAITGDFNITKAN